ncbi:hypothetical protein [Streptomyces sp. TE12347]
MSLMDPLRTTWNRRLRRWGDEGVAEFRADLDRLGYGWWPIPPRLKLTLRQAYVSEVPRIFFALAGLMLVYSVMSCFVIMETLYKVRDPPWRWILAWVVWCVLLMKICAATKKYSLQWRRSQLTLACKATIHACSEAYIANHTQRADKLSAVEVSLRRLEGDVMRAYRRSGTLSYGSPRRRELKLHAGMVVAKLREAEAALDRGPHQPALDEIAGLVATIAEQNVAGHFGTLLPKAALEGRLPHRDPELYLIVAGVVLVAAGFVGLSFLPLPVLAVAALGIMWAVLVLISLFGSKWTRYIYIVDLFKPGP